MGVNLPAHLVIIKSTDCYQGGVVTPAPISQIIQMIGRAGRPQFDTHAKAVIMAKNQEKEKLLKCLEGQQTIESCLHLSILEHLNTEINLRTVKCRQSALIWMKSTFLYVRVQKDPQKYCLKIEPGSSESIDQFLTNIVAENLDCLERAELVQRSRLTQRRVESGECFSITTLGAIMALKALKFKTMELFLGLSKYESIHQLVTCLSKIEDLSGTVLRTDERKILNSLITRIPYKLHISKVKTASDKASVLIHATLSSVQISEFNIQQDVNQIFKILPRVASALVQVMEYRKFFVTLKNAYLLLQSIRTRMWHNSKFVSRQIHRLGQSSASLMARAGFTTFASIRQADPRNLEVVLNRHAPFGNALTEFAKYVPEVSLKMNQLSSTEGQISVEVILTLENVADISRKSNSSQWHKFAVIVGTSQNYLLLETKVSERVLKTNKVWTRTISAPSDKSLLAYCISSAWCGVGATCSIKKIDFNDLPDNGNPFVLLPQEIHTLSKSGAREKRGKETEKNPKEAQVCKHTCKDKSICAHSCCKVGLVSQKLNTSAPTELKTLASSVTPKVQSAFLGNLNSAKETRPKVSSVFSPSRTLSFTQNEIVGASKSNQINFTQMSAPGRSILKTKSAYEYYSSSRENSATSTPNINRDGNGSKKMQNDERNKLGVGSSNTHKKKFEFKPKGRQDTLVPSNIIKVTDCACEVELQKVTTPVKRKLPEERDSVHVVGPSPSKKLSYTPDFYWKNGHNEPTVTMPLSNSVKVDNNQGELLVFGDFADDDGSISYSPMEEPEVLEVKSPESTKAIGKSLDQINKMEAKVKTVDLEIDVWDDESFAFDVEELERQADCEYIPHVSNYKTPAFKSSKTIGHCKPKVDNRDQSSYAQKIIVSKIHTPKVYSVRKQYLAEKLESKVNNLAPICEIKNPVWKEKNKDSGNISVLQESITQKPYEFGDKISAAMKEMYGSQPKRTIEDLDRKLGLKFTDPYKVSKPVDYANIDDAEIAKIDTPCLRTFYKYMKQTALSTS